MWALKYLQLFSEKATSEEKEKNYFVKSEKEIDEEDKQSFKNSIELNEKELVTSRKIRIAQQSPNATRKQKFVASLLMCHIVLQFFLPYSHFISKVPSSLTLININFF